MNEIFVSGMLSFKWNEQMGGRPQPELVKINPNLGLGYNSITEETKQIPALAAPVAPSNNDIAHTEYQIIKIEDRESLRSTLSVGISASYGDVTGSANASVNLYRSLATETYTLMILIRVVVTLREETYPTGELNVVPELEALAKRKKANAIADTYGDSYISKIIYGGEYSVLVNLSTSSRSEYEALSVAASGAVGGYSAGASFASTLSILKQFSSMSVSQVIDGVVTPVPNLDKVEEYAMDFPTKVQASGGTPVKCVMSPITGSNWPADFRLDFRKEKRRVEDLIEIMHNVELLQTQWKYISEHTNQYVGLSTAIVEQKLNGLNSYIKKITREIEDIDFDMGEYNPANPLPDYDLSEYKQLPTLKPVLRPRLRSTWIEGSSTAAPQQQVTNGVGQTNNWIRSSGGSATNLFGLAIELLDMPEGLELWMSLMSGSPSRGATPFGPSHELQNTIGGDFLSGVAFELRGPMADQYFIEYSVHCNEVGNSEIWGNTASSTRPLGDFALKQLYAIQGLRVLLYPR